MSYAELQSVRGTSEKLTQGEQKLKAMLNKVNDDERALLRTQEELNKKKDELDKIIKSTPTDAQLNIGSNLIIF